MSLFPVMLDSHFSSVSSSTSSGWIRVESSRPEYIHIGWSRAWRGWMRRLRNTSNRSMPVTPSQTKLMTWSTKRDSSPFSSRVTISEEGWRSLSIVKGGRRGVVRGIERGGEGRQAAEQVAWRGGARARRPHSPPSVGTKTTEEGDGLGRLPAGPASWLGRTGRSPGKLLLLFILPFSNF